MNEYNAIAGVYDRINSGVDYEKWADMAETLFVRLLGKRPELILDLACGTGRMTLTLARRCYDMIGVDRSPEMLARATDALYDLIDGEKFSESAPRPLFLCQDMKDFELYGTVGAVLCCLDSLNYLTEDGDLDAVFDKVANYLDTDGIFLFDMNTPYKFENIYGENSYVYDVADGESFCVWQNFYDKKTKLCDFYLTVFERDADGKYERTDEEQCERCYSMDEIKTALERSGMELAAVYADYCLGEPAPDTPRWYFAARNKREHRNK